jgi:hypothetical protein
MPLDPEVVRLQEMINANQNMLLEAMTRQPKAPQVLNMRRINLWERALEFIFPWRKRAREKRLEEMTGWLVAHPDVPVKIH